MDNSWAFMGIYVQKEKKYVLKKKEKSSCGKERCFGKLLYLCNEKLIKRQNMEATTTTTTTPKRRISKTARWARTHKWVIEVVDPELQKQCKAYKDGQRIIRP